jgi:hypothetical protein
MANGLKHPRLTTAPGQLPMRAAHGGPTAAWQPVALPGQLRVAAHPRRRDGSRQRLRLRGSPATGSALRGSRRGGWRRRTSWKGTEAWTSDCDVRHGEKTVRQPTTTTAVANSGMLRAPVSCAQENRRVS